MLIKHNNDMLQCVDDKEALLDKLHLYSRDPKPRPSSLELRSIR